MSAHDVFRIIVYVGHTLLLPPLLVGFIRLGKARLQGRVGPPLWQPFYDLAKLMGKSETISETTTWVFRWAPIVSLATLVPVALMVPWLGIPSPIPGDLFLVVYLVV